MTGNPLLDEKIFGTIHIAIGNNIGWQGRNKAQLHLDIITKAPTLKVDGRTLLDKGRHVVKPEEFDNLASYQPHSRYVWPDGAQIAEMRREIVDKDDSGATLIKLDKAHSGRITEVPLADEHTRRLVAQLLRLPGRVPSVSSLMDQDAQPLTPEMRQKLLSFLWSYGLVQPAR